MLAKIVWPPKLANIPPWFVFLIQIINGNCIFSHLLAKLANMVQDKKLTNILIDADDLCAKEGWRTFVDAAVTNHKTNVDIIRDAHSVLACLQVLVYSKSNTGF